MHAVVGCRTRRTQQAATSVSPSRVCPSVSPDLVFLTSMFPRLDKLADMLGDGGSPTDWVKKKKKV
jgi:hypothetical protein